jgi:N-acetylglucosamine malate deacetylase 1
MSKKILVIAPHADDELLGVGGSLYIWKKQGYRIKIVLVACTDIYMCHQKGIVSAEVRKKEFSESCKVLSTEPYSNFELEDSKLDTLPITSIVAKLDNEIRNFEPDIILYPEPSYHQDHQVVNKACTSSLRPTKKRPHKVLTYEIPTSSWVGSGTPFIPNVYVDITESIDIKRDTFCNVYKSQFSNSSRQGLAIQGVTSHAQSRGFECNVKYAEALKLIYCVGL